MSQSKGHIGKLYKFAIRRWFLKIKHPSFANRWFTLFKWEDRVDDSKVKSEMDRIGINSDTQRARLRQCLKTNTPSNIRKPSLETCLAAMRTEVHIAKLKSHPTGKVRNCLKCDDELSNTEHSL